MAMPSRKTRRVAVPSADLPPPNEVSAFLRYFRNQRRRAEGTCETYKHYLKYHIRWLSEYNKDMHRPTVADAKAFWAWLVNTRTKLGRQIAPTTVNAVMAATSEFYRYLLAKGGNVLANPYASKDLRFENHTKLNTPTVTCDTASSVRYLNEKERAVVLKWINTRPPPHVRIAFLLMLGAGLRISEATTADASNVREDGTVVSIVVHENSHEYRCAPVIDPKIAQQIAAAASTAGTGTFAKVSRSTILWWARVCKNETGIDFTTYRLRHTYGLNCASENIPLEVLQVNMGHSCIGTTHLYHTKSNKRIRDAIQSIVRRKTLR